MKKQLLLFLGTILTINCYAQISFEKGYYIPNSGQKIDCLIKNNDWKNNPIDFEYKVSEDDEAKKIGLKLVKEFGIYNDSKFIRKTVEIDESSENVSALSNEQKPIFKEEQLFLKVLVEGKANLYLFEDINLRRYFYNIENSDVEQLIFKSYKTSDNKIGKNNRFRQQLWNDLKCSTIKENNVKNLDYKKNSLINFFIKYNLCSNSEFINYNEEQKRDLFNLTLRPRLNNSSLTIKNPPSNNRDTDFGARLGFGFGIEAEYILPFNNNKWAISIEPTYQNFKAEETTELNNGSGRIILSEVKYNSVELPISLRYYFFLNHYSKFFINASYIIDISSKSSINFKRPDNSDLNSLDINARNNLAFGLGYKIYDKYSLEIRYQTNRDILGDFSFYKSEYKTFSIILGYSLF